MNLAGLVTEYLEALGYETHPRGRDLLVGHRLSIAGERESILVWIPGLEPGQSFSTQEGPYLSRFETAAKEYPRAQKFMLFETYEGVSRDFRSRAKGEYDVNVRVPILFFDTPFRDEAWPGRIAGTASRDLAIRGAEWAARRVPQPYVLVRGTEIEHGRDILDLLTRKIEGQSGTGLNLIVGPAGMGKTVLFEVLFSWLYSKFQERKEELRVFPRPLPLVPEYLRASVALTLRGVIEAFLRTEFAAPINVRSFEWMLVNGFGLWLLDGLDELIDRDPDFFDQFLEILTKPGTVEPTIVLCVRDSLLATNKDLRDFLDGYPGAITIYELSRWETPSKRAFAKKEFGEREAEAFMAMLRTHTELDTLSAIPYYCKLISEEYKAGRLRESYSEPELLSCAILNIIEREYGEKERLDRTLLPAASLNELLQDLASEDTALGFAGIPRETIKDYTEILLPTELDHQTLERLVTHVVQLALFSQGPVAGTVRFTHEILEHYLLGERLWRCLCTNENAFLREVSIRRIPADWVTLKTVASKVQSEGDLGRLLNWLGQPGLSDTAFGNVLQICALAAKDPGALRRVLFEGRDISGAKFKGFDFRSVSFRRCNLTDVEFDECLLQDAKFEGAIIDRTAFFLKDREDLKGATFGDMERFHSVWTERRKLETHQGAVKEWLQKCTGVVEAIVEPCAAAKQLRYLFGKYVYPNGKAKRAILNRRAVLTGTMFYDREETLEAAIRHGYLVPELRYRDRIARCDGDMYREMVSYVTDLAVSEGLRRLLNELCPVEDCQHVPPKQNP